MLYFGVFGTGLAPSPVVPPTRLSLCDALGSALCIFGGLSYLHKQFSESSAEKQLFFLGTARNHEYVIFVYKVAFLCL